MSELKSMFSDNYIAVDEIIPFLVPSSSKEWFSKFTSVYRLLGKHIADIKNNLQYNPRHLRLEATTQA